MWVLAARSPITNRLEKANPTAGCAQGFVCVQKRMVFHQAGENTVRYSIRSRKTQLSPISRLVGRVGPLGRSVSAAYRVAERAGNQVLDTALSCSKAVGYYRTDRSG